MTLEEKFFGGVGPPPAGGTNYARAGRLTIARGAEWQAAKEAGTTNGLTWPQFLSQCRANLKSGTPSGPSPSTMGASMGGQPPLIQTVPAPPPTQGGFAPSTPQGGPMAGKTIAQCDAEYAANKAGIRASGQTKRAFVAACRAGNETIPQRAAAAPAAAPAPAPAQPQTGSLFPWQQPAAPAPAPAPANYGAPAPAPTGAAQFASAQEAQYRCPGAAVVWVNTNSHVYHFAGNRNYGNTHHGAFMCEADAQAAGNRAAKNERHP
jgi:hypothetical protein